MHPPMFRIRAPERWPAIGRSAAHRPPGDVGTAEGKRLHLRELMTNLIFNAVDALPMGGTIRCGWWLSSGRASSK